MHFENSPRDRDFLNRVKAFINEEIEPVEAAYWREVASTCPSSDWNNGVHTLCGHRADLLNTPIKVIKVSKVSTMFPGHISTVLNEGAKKLPFKTIKTQGSLSIVRAIEREPGTVCVPVCPWSLREF